MEKRPLERDDECLKAIARELTPALTQWAGDNIDEDINMEESIFNTLENCLLDWDGYYLAKHFENQTYFEGDSGLVDILDRASMSAHKINNNRTKEWVKNNKIEPKLSIGDFVEARINYRTETGKINKIKKETAEYVVNTNKAENYKTYGGTVFGYERVTKIDIHL